MQNVLLSRPLPGELLVQHPLGSLWICQFTKSTKQVGKQTKIAIVALCLSAVKLRNLAITGLYMREMSLPFFLQVVSTVQ